eukprot:1184678-Prorocentrum_minimum.AAC.4
MDSPVEGKRLRGALHHGRPLARLHVVEALRVHEPGGEAVHSQPRAQLQCQRPGQPLMERGTPPIT